MLIWASWNSCVIKRWTIGTCHLLRLVDPYIVLPALKVRRINARWSRCSPNIRRNLNVRMDNSRTNPTTGEFHYEYRFDDVVAVVVTSSNQTTARTTDNEAISTWPKLIHQSAIGAAISLTDCFRRSGSVDVKGNYERHRGCLVLRRAPGHGR